jgi:hypothetical protein
MTEPYGLTEAQIRLIQDLLDADRRKSVNPVQRSWAEEEDYQPPEVYVALVPLGGIRGIEGRYPANPIIHYGDCLLYRKLPVDDGPVVLAAVDGIVFHRVYNLSTLDLSEYQWVLVKRDKFGDYFTEGCLLCDVAGTGTGPPPPDHPCDCPPVVITDVEITTIVGDTNITYIVYNSVTNTVVTYLWVCVNGVCGWLNLCTCVWKPFTEPYWCVDETIPMAWWCVKTVAGTGSGSVSSALNCPKCPDGAPAKWLLNVASVSTTPFQALAGSWEVEWFASPDYAAAGLCVWDTSPGTITFPRWTLTYTGTDRDARRRVYRAGRRRGRDRPRDRAGRDVHLCTSLRGPGGGGGRALRVGGRVPRGL